MYDETNPDWLPTLHLGHTKKQSSSEGTASERWARRKAREETAKTVNAVEALLSLADGDPNNDRSTDEAPETADVASQTDLTSCQLRDMQKQLDDQRSVIDDLTLQLTQIVAPFSEQSLTSDEIVKFYTGLPNISWLKRLFKIVIHVNSPLFKNLWLQL